MALAHSPSIVRTGLVLCMDPANIKSYPGTGTAWTDVSGQGNGATLNSSPEYSSGYLTFNGSSKRAVLSTPVASASQLTAVMWHQRVEAESSTTWRTLLATTSTNIHHLLYQQTTRNLGLWDGSFKDFTYNPPQDSKFHCYAVVYTSGVEASLYIDGEFVKTVSTSLNLTTSPIGSIGNWSSGNYWSGRVSAVQVYNRGLTAQEIKQNFHALRGRYGL